MQIDCRRKNEIYQRKLLDDRINMAVKKYHSTRHRNLLQVKPGTKK
jgi:hypothetical protein